MTTKKKIPWLKLPGNPLPKRLLRPFLLEAAYSLDDKRYVRIGLGDRIGVLELPMGFAYAISGGAGFIWAVSGFEVTPALVVALVSLSVALTMHYYLRRMKPTQFIVFDREKGTVSYPHFLSTTRSLEAPWEEWGARLWRASNSSGALSHVLSLVHLPTYTACTLDSSITSIDRVLGYWSFLVQYMDKDGPLPDIPNLVELDKYPNRSKGLGTWEEWEKEGLGFTRCDPYYEWLAELKAAPELDVLNREIERNRRG